MSNSHPLFKSQLFKYGIDKRSIDKLYTRMRSKKISQGQELTLEVDTKLFFINNGVIRECALFFDGKITTEAMWFDGRFIPCNCSEETCSITKYYCQEDAEILYASKCDLFNVDSTRLDSFILNEHSKTSKTIKDIALSRTLIGKREHIILNLCAIFTAKQYRGQNTLEATIEDLCSQSGATRQYYHKVLNELADKRLLRRGYGCIEVYDLEALISELSSDLYLSFKSHILDIGATAY